jgi:release factor glutamine methyltransferase
MQTSEARLAANLLLAHVLQCTTTHIFAHPERRLTGDEFSRFRQLVTRRAEHEPVAYLVGHQAFLDLDLLVDRNVLIPRPDTEVLVEATLRIARKWVRPRIADVGTGSGAIALALAKHLPSAQIYALDHSLSALEVARRNAQRLHLAERIVFQQSDLLAGLHGNPGQQAKRHPDRDSEKETHPPVQLEVIVANLPYVSESEYAALPADIRLYEPPEALVAGRDGLSAIRALLESAPPHLTTNGAVLLEIGASQGPAVTKLGEQAFPKAHIEILPDYAHRDRVLCITHF